MDSDNHGQHTSEHEADQSVPRELELQVPGSYVWKHFTKDPDYKNNKKASCNYCKKIYICSAGTTSGISKHLQKHHTGQVNHQKAQKSVIDMLNESKVKYIILFILLKTLNSINNKYIYNY